MKKQLICTRHKAREKSLQCLYMADMTNNWSNSTINIFTNNFIAQEYPSSMKDLSDRFKFFIDLTQVTFKFKEYIDYWLARASLKRDVPSICVVDRNIIRLAVAEMLFFQDIPLNVSINEAIELAKTYGNIESPLFVNGVTDKIAQFIKTGKMSAQDCKKFIEASNIQLAS